MFAFVLISPLTVFVLHRGGPKLSIIIASALLLIGNWIRYASTKAGAHYGGVMAGQIFIGFAQPFVLAAPTRYSDLWFSNSGRVAATALMSLANPLGGALAQLINPFWASENHPEQVPNMVLYVTIIVRSLTLLMYDCLLTTLGNYRLRAILFYPTLSPCKTCCHFLKYRNLPMC